MSVSTVDTHSSPTSHGFPDYEEIEHEKSIITLPIRVNGDVIETVQLEAFLKLHRFEPAAVLGIRQFEFKILRWEVIGESQVLGGVIGFSLSDVPQPKSVCIANGPAGDFPATIVYSAVYDIYHRGQAILKNQAGIGIGRDVRQIPPRGISVTFQKPFAVGATEALAGDCATMMSLEASEWEEAANRAERRLKGHS